MPGLYQRQRTRSDEPRRSVVLVLSELVLVTRAWTWAGVVFSESFEALVEGLQRALWALGGVPHQLPFDIMPAATHDHAKGRGRSLNKCSADVCDHFDFEKIRRFRVHAAHEKRRGRSRAPPDQAADQAGRSARARAAFGGARPGDGPRPYRGRGRGPDPPAMRVESRVCVGPRSSASA
jgi:hypothetical protein